MSVKFTNCAHYLSAKQAEHLGIKGGAHCALEVKNFCPAECKFLTEKDEEKE